MEGAEKKLLQEIKTIVQDEVKPLRGEIRVIVREEVKPLRGEIRVIVREEVKGEIDGFRKEVKGEIDGLRGEIDGLRKELWGGIDGLRGEMDGLRKELWGGIDGLREEMKGEIGGLRDEMKTIVRDEVAIQLVPVNKQLAETYKLAQRSNVLYEDLKADVRLIAEAVTDSTYIRKKVGDHDTRIAELEWRVDLHEKVLKKAS